MSVSNSLNGTLTTFATASAAERLAREIFAREFDPELALGRWVVDLVGGLPGHHPYDRIADKLPGLLDRFCMFAAGRGWPAKDGEPNSQIPLKVIPRLQEAARVVGLRAVAELRCMGDVEVEPGSRAALVRRLKLVLVDRPEARAS